MKVQPIVRCDDTNVLKDEMFEYIEKGKLGHGITLFERKLNAEIISKIASTYELPTNISSSKVRNIKTMQRCEANRNRLKVYRRMSLYKYSKKSIQNHGSISC